MEKNWADDQSRDFHCKCFFVPFLLIIVSLAVFMQKAGITDLDIKKKNKKNLKQE